MKQGFHTQQSLTSLQGMIPLLTPDVTIRELVRMRMRFSVNEDRTPLNFIALYWFGLTGENPVTKQVTFNNDSCHRCALHMMSEPT